MLRSLFALAVLGRLNLAPLTISVPLLGAVAAHLALSIPLGFGLAWLGLGAHFFGFGLNDLIDHTLDRNLPERQHHPLAIGVLPQRLAWVVVLSVGLSVGLLYWGMGGTWAGFVALSVSGALSVVYNRWSKQGWLPRWLAELALALAVGGLCLAGAWLVRFALTPPILSVAGALSLVVLLLNSLASGLKDLATDAAFGAQSFVLATGSAVQPDGTLYISPLLWRYFIVLQSVLIFVWLLLVWAWSPAWWQLLIIACLALYGALHLRLLLTLPTFTALRHSLPLLSGYYNYTALLWFTFEHWPFWMQVALGLFTTVLLIYPWQLAWRIWRRMANGR